VVQAAQPAGIFLGHTAAGRDLAPLLAAVLGCGAVTDVIAVEPGGACSPGPGGSAAKAAKAATAAPSRHQPERGANDSGTADAAKAGAAATGAAAANAALPDTPPVFTRPLYAGKALERRTALEPFVVTVRPNNIPAPEPDISAPPPAVIAIQPAKANLRAVV